MEKMKEFYNKHKLTCNVTLIGGTIYAVLFVTGIADVDTPMGANLITSIACYPAVFIVWQMFYAPYRYFTRKKRMTPEQLEAYEQKKADEKAKKLEAQARAVRSQTITNVTLLNMSDNYKTKKKGVITRTVVGGALAGPVGAVVGGATAKSKTVAKGGSATFLIEYANGTKSSKTVKVGSSEYNRLIQYL